MMEESIGRFTEQFDWQPQLQNTAVLGDFLSYIVVGMGGSHLAAWFIQQYSAVSNITIHRDYGIPECSVDTLIILTSYSGDTEEVLDAARTAFARKLSMVIITRGGKLLAFAQEHSLPYIQIPDMHFEPRMAIGLLMLATAVCLKNMQLENAIRVAGKSVIPTEGKEEGARLAQSLAGKVPLMYSSSIHAPLAYVWKVNMNETAKIPAFSNVFPELCHNEISGFDVVDSTRAIAEQFYPVFFEDMSDHPRVQKRMQVLKSVLEEKNIPVEIVRLHGMGFEKVFRGVLLASWTSMYLAQHYGVPNPETPLIAEFKQRME